MIIDIVEGGKAIKEKKRKAKKKASGPDANCVTQGSDGEYYKYSVEYGFKGKLWTFEIWAKSEKEARLRVDSIKRFPVDIAQIVAERPI